MTSIQSPWYRTGAGIVVLSTAGVAMAQQEYEIM
jgi:hypothetical protein